MCLCFRGLQRNTRFVARARSPSSALLPFFGEGSPTKVACRKQRYPHSNLSTGGPRGLDGQGSGLGSYRVCDPSTCSRSVKSAAAGGSAMIARRLPHGRSIRSPSKPTLIFHDPEKAVAFGRFSFFNQEQHQEGPCFCGPLEDQG